MEPSLPARLLAAFPAQTKGYQPSRCIFGCTPPSTSQFRTMDCVCQDSFAPSRTASCYLSPRSLAMDMRVSIDVASSDCSAENEFVSQVHVGAYRLRTSFLVSGGEDNQCGAMNRVTDEVRAPHSSRGNDGAVDVHIFTSPDVGGVVCADGSSLKAIISISWVSPSIRHGFSEEFRVYIGQVASMQVLRQPTFGFGGEFFSPQPQVILLDRGGNMAQFTGSVRATLARVPMDDNKSFAYSDVNCTDTWAASCATQSNNQSTFKECMRNCASPENMQGTEEVVVNNSFARFTDLAVDLPGRYFLKFELLNHTTKPAFSDDLIISIGEVASLRVAEEPSPSFGGEACHRQPRILVVDRGGNNVTHANGRVSATLLKNGSVNARLYGNRAARVNQAVANFTDLIVDLDGNFTLEFNYIPDTPTKTSASVSASASTLPGVNSNTVTPARASFRNRAGPASRLSAAVMYSNSSCFGNVSVDCLHFDEEKWSVLVTLKIPGITSDQFFNQGAYQRQKGAVASGFIGSAVDLNYNQIGGFGDAIAKEAFEIAISKACDLDSDSVQINSVVADTGDPSTLIVQVAIELSSRQVADSLAGLLTASLLNTPLLQADLPEVNLVPPLPFVKRDNWIVAAREGNASIACCGSCTCQSSIGQHTTGTFSHGSSHYGMNQTYWWLISADADIAIWFTSFDTEAGYDIVSLFQCTSADCVSKERVAQLSGNKLDPDTIFESSTGVMLVEFSTDASVTAAGFVAHYHARALPYVHLQVMDKGGNIVQEARDVNVKVMERREQRVAIDCKGDYRCAVSVNFSSFSLPSALGLPSLGYSASGLQWEYLGLQHPSQGQELMNAELAEALKHTTTFTQEEWDSFGVADLQPDHFIRSGVTNFESFFAPAASMQTVVDAVLDISLKCTDFDGASERIAQVIVGREGGVGRIDLTKVDPAGSHVMVGPWEACARNCNKSVNVLQNYSVGTLVRQAVLDGEESLEVSLQVWHA